MNLSEVSKFQVLTCLFGVCLIIGIAVMDHKQNNKLKSISKTQAYVLLDDLDTLVGELQNDAADKDMKKVGILIQMVERNLDEDFKEDLQTEKTKFDTKLKGRIDNLKTEINTGKSNPSEKELKQFKATLNVIKEYAGSLTEEDYKQVKAALKDYETKL